MKTPGPHIESWWSKAFNLSILKNNRFPWVDYLRGIAILLVVYRHVLIGLERSHLNIPASFVTANMIFYSFRMPLFFILSGIFINSSIVKRTVKQLIYIKFENILYPYLVWAVIQVSLQIVLAGFTNSDRTLEDYTFILYQPRALDQLWYLPALFNATVVYILIKTKINPPAWVHAIICLVFYFLSSYIHISMLSDWMGFYLFFALGDAVSKFFFRESTQRFLKNPWVLLGIIPVFVGVQLYYLSNAENYYLDTNPGRLQFLLIALIGCFSMFVLAFRLQSLNILSFLRILGYHSLYIYVMHVLVAAFVRMVLTRFAHIHDPAILLTCGIAAGVTIPVVVYNMLIKDNIGWWLFSLEKPKPRVKKSETTQAA